MSEYVIIHSRTKGSKNGIRRYQFTDGTWTEEGKARRRSGYGTITPKQAEKITRKAGELVDASSRIVDRAGKEIPHKNPKEMSDKELREELNRLRMEQEYNNLSQKQVSEGAEKLKNILEYTGDAIVIAGGLVALWATLQESKG